MTKLFLAAGVAALAIAVPAVAKPDKQGGGKGQSAQVQKSERGQKGNAKASKARQAPVRAQAKQRERDVESRASVAKQRGKAQEKAAERAQKARGERAKAQVRVAQDRRKSQQKAFEQRNKMAEKAVERREKQLDRVTERRREAFRDRDVRIERLAEQRREAYRDRDWDDRTFLRSSNQWAEGCPPGLAKKAVPCMPPGQAKKVVGHRVDALRQFADLRELPDRLRYVYPDTDDYYYRYGNGYAYRVNRETQLISSLLPLFGLGVTTGQPFPTAYDNSNYYLPSGLQPFYENSPYDYRYANGYVYEVDPYTGLVADVDPMLGYGYGYGQMLPATYSAYNVPYQYRPYYQDTSDHYYRYAPGAIYRVDSGSGLIDAVSALLTGGMAVGQPLPMGYDVYNVPMAYRDQYYDRQDAWYRYADGNIYQVDPTTRLVTAIVQALT